MGYYLFITRDEHWWDNRDPISRNEWLRVVADDPAFVPDADNPDALTLAGCEVRPAFHYDEDTGSIWVRAGYFEEVLPKVLEAAAKLGAVVVGEEGEFYRLTDHGPEQTPDRPDLPGPG